MQDFSSQVWYSYLTDWQQELVEIAQRLLERERNSSSGLGTSSVGNKNGEALNANPNYLSNPEFSEKNSAGMKYTPEYKLLTNNGKKKNKKRQAKRCI